MNKAQEKLTLAQKHLARVQLAWDPPDWADLSMYGLYCLEAAVDAAAMIVGVAVRGEHRIRVQAAITLAQGHGFPDVSELLRELNTVRKSEAYGDVEAPQLNAEEVAMRIEEFVELVAKRIENPS